MPKRIKTTCNICLNDQTELKCSECTFECCYKCIYEWSDRSHNCPQCGKFETYDIEYSLIVSDEDSIYDFEIYAWNAAGSRIPSAPFTGATP